MRASALCALLAGCLSGPDVSRSLYHCNAEHRACPEGFVCNTGQERDACQRPCDPTAPSCPTGFACIDYGDSAPKYFCGLPSDDGS